MDERLTEIVAWIEPGDLVADIGTDHGKIPLHLIEARISEEVYATDISAHSLSKLEKEIERRGIKTIHTCVSDGLKGLPDRSFDVFILAGMGGRLIEKILRESMKKAKAARRLILQPNVGAPNLRRFLHDNGFKILDEKLVRVSGKYYEIFLAGKGQQNFVSDLEYEFGFHLISRRDKILKEKLEREKRISEKILATLSTKGKKDSLGARRLIEKRNRINEVLSKYED